MAATTPPAAAEGNRRGRVFLAADWIGSLDAAAKTAAVIGLVLGLYVAGHALGQLLQHLGWLLYAAANGA